ncbi:MAG: hypothetical protein U0942_15955 [Parvibaculum sp.]|uniref:hypothetical protein n=1 Tax=Parvibaculum sp. TaxID=2024848 RepID=UPI002AB834FD|nr:hypothetical protein [Parvibaculum sp.]MDZ4382826.1 hypothetical protein [Parvibaculum sp.]
MAAKRKTKRVTALEKARAEVAELKRDGDERRAIIAQLQTLCGQQAEGLTRPEQSQAKWRGFARRTERTLDLARVRLMEAARVIDEDIARGAGGSAAAASAMRLVALSARMHIRPGGRDGCADSEVLSEA